MNNKAILGVFLCAAVLGGCQEDSKKSAAAPAASSAGESASTSTAATGGAITLETEEQQVSYGIGLNLGENLKKQSVSLDFDSFIAGVRDATDGKEPKMDKAEIMKVMQSFQQKMVAKRQAERSAAGEGNKADGEAYLAANAKKDGVEITESGLQYKVITTGEGAKPSADDTVEVNYKGTLINGEEFDSSYKRGKPVSFPVKGVIAGWTEALQLMTVGSKWELVIPADLAYGPGGTGPIGPNSTLIFEVELISIKAPATAAKPAAEKPAAEKPAAEKSAG